MADDKRSAAKEEKKDRSKDKSVEQLTDESLDKVSGGKKCFPERVCEPLKPCLPQCSPHCPPTRMCKPR